jgi:lysophospholipase L1-like esterase
MKVGSSPVYLAPVSDFPREIAVVAGSAVYLKSSQDVSSTSYDRSLSAGQAVEWNKGAWLLSASQSEIAITASPASAPVPSSSFGRRLLRKLSEGLEDCSIVVIGDSTGAGYATWVGKVLDALASRYPAYTVKYRDWTDGESEYNSASTKQTGSGSKTLTLYNASVASTNAHYHMAPYFEAMVASRQPDLIFFNHGHNHGATLEPFWWDGLTVTTETITRACPASEVVVIAQNPRTDANKEVQAKRQFVTEQVAQMRGFGFANIHRVFLNADLSASSLLNEDGIHPNSTGHTLWATEIFRLLSLEGRPATQPPSSFLLPVVANGFANGDFSSFASPPTLPSWTATNATLEKDTTNFESANGYAVKMKTTTPGSASRIQQGLSGNALRRFNGEWATMTARVRIPSGSTGIPGRVSIVENNGSHAGTSSSDSLTKSGVGLGTNGFRWTKTSRRIAADCTSLTCTIACEESPAGEVTIDRVSLVPGALPKDTRA